MPFRIPKNVASKLDKFKVAVGVQHTRKGVEVTFNSIQTGKQIGEKYYAPKDTDEQIVFNEAYARLPELKMPKSDAEIASELAMLKAENERLKAVVDSMSASGKILDNNTLSIQNTTATGSSVGGVPRTDGVELRVDQVTPSDYHKMSAADLAGIIEDRDMVIPDGDRRSKEWRANAISLLESDDDVNK